MFLTDFLAQKRPILTPIITTLLLSLAAAACGSAPMTPAPVPDSVSSVTDMVPALGTKLLHGQTVTFTGTAGYSLNSADSGQVVLVIQAAARRYRPSALEWGRRAAPRPAP